MSIKKTEYKKERNGPTFRRIELWFTPLLISLPIVVSIFLIRDWFYRGFSKGISTYDGELFLAIIILIGNIILKRNTLMQNYWNSSKLFPKLIFGILYFGDFSLNWFNIDLLPASEPYDIPGSSNFVGCGIK